MMQDCCYHVTSCHTKSGLFYVQVEHKANIFARNTSGSTALHWAASDSKVDTLRYLLELKMNPSLANTVCVSVTVDVKVNAFICSSFC